MIIRIQETTKQQKNKMSNSICEYESFRLSKTKYRVFEYAQKLKYPLRFNTKVFDISKLNIIKEHGGLADESKTIN